MSFVDSAIGKKFGKLSVISVVRTPGRRLLKCRCDCGIECVADPRMLKRGDTTSCGCFRKESARTRRSANLVGQRFGRLVVTSQGPDILRGGRTNLGWMCACDCGERRHLTSNALLTGNTRSCGCYNRDQITAARQSEASYLSIFNIVSKRAVQRELVWELSPEQAEALFKGDCAYCGEAPKVGIRSSLPSNGIDRVDNKLGYVVGNCVSCCTVCNMMKHTMPRDKFEEQIINIYKHLKIKGI